LKRSFFSAPSSCSSELGPVGSDPRPNARASLFSRTLAWPEHGRKTPPLNSTPSRIHGGTGRRDRRRPPSHNLLGDVRGVFRGGLNHDIRTGAPGSLQFCVLETRCITTHISKGVRARAHATVTPESDGLHSMGLLSSPTQKFYLCLVSSAAEV
jgi:hypothetical protein